MSMTDKDFVVPDFYKKSLYGAIKRHDGARVRAILLELFFGFASAAVFAYVIFQWGTA